MIFSVDGHVQHVWLLLIVVQANKTNGAQFILILFNDVFMDKLFIWDD